MIPMKPLHQQQIQGRVLRWPHLKKKNGGRRHTPPKFNIEPENGGFPKGISFSSGPFSGSMLNFRDVPPSGCETPPICFTQISGDLFLPMFDVLQRTIPTDTFV